MQRLSELWCDRMVGESKSLTVEDVPLKYVDNQHEKSMINGIREVSQNKYLEAHEIHRYICISISN